MAGKETEMQELMPEEVAATVPPLYATEEERDPVVRVKLFSCVSGWTWYVTEYDPATGLSGFVYDTERDAVRDPLRSEGWIEL